MEGDREKATNRENGLISGFISYIGFYRGYTVIPQTLTLIDTPLPNTGFMTVSNGPINKSLQADINVCQPHQSRQGH